MFLKYTSLHTQKTESVSSCLSSLERYEVGVEMTQDEREEALAENTDDGTRTHTSEETRF